MQGLGIRGQFLDRSANAPASVAESTQISHSLHVLTSIQQDHRVAAEAVVVPMNVTGTGVRGEAFDIRGAPFMDPHSNPTGFGFARDASFLKSDHSLLRDARHQGAVLGKHQTVT